MDSDTRDKVIQTHTMVTGINARLKKIDKLYENLEKRVRRGELFRAWFMGISGCGGLAAGVKAFMTGPGPGG